MNKESTLLIYNLFIATPNAKEARTAFLEYIVEFVLFNSKVSLTPEGVINKVNGFFPNPISSELIAASLKRVAIEEGSFDEKKYCLSEERRNSFNLAINRYNKDRDTFYNKLINKVQETISEELTPIEKRQLCETTERVITNIFSDKYKLIEQAFHPKDGFDIYRLEEKEYDNLLKNEIGKVFSTKHDIEKIKYGIIKALKQLDDDGIKYVASIFHKVFAFFYLNQEPNELQNEIRLLKRRKIYLDANVVLKLIFPSQGKRKEISPLIDKCRELKIQLLITPNTLKEIEGQFDRAEKIFMEGGGLNPEIRSRYSTQTKKDLIIVDDYLNEKIENKFLDWNVYIKSFKPILEYLLKRFDIRLDTDQWPKVALENIPEIDSIRKAIKDTKEKHQENIKNEKPVSFDSTICDSQNIYFIHQIRNKFQTDDMGIRVWHLTYDIQLVRSEKLVRHLFKIPACMTVPQLADFLIPFSMTTMEEVSHSQFVTSLLGADFGAIVEDENYVDIDFYASISNSGLPLEHILNLTDDRFTRKILILFQENKKARELFEEIEKTEDAKKKSLIGAELKKELMSISAEPKFKETIDNLVARINKLEIEKASMKKGDTFVNEIWEMVKDKFKLYSRVMLDLFSLILLNYLVILVYAKLDTKSELMGVLKLISHIVIILFVGFDAIKELRKAWKETKEF